MTLQSGAKRRTLRLFARLLRALAALFLLRMARQIEARQEVLQDCNTDINVIEDGREYMLAIAAGEAQATGVFGRPIEVGRA